MGKDDPSALVAVIDTETTGLDPAHDRITEVAVIVSSLDGDIKAFYQSLVMVDVEIPYRVEQLTGITNDLLKARGRPLDVVMRRVADFVRDLPVVAYNASFDMAFLAAESRRSGVYLPYGESICALEAARETWPILNRHRLADVCTYIGAPAPGHRAMADCLATHDVYIYSRTSSAVVRLETPHLVIGRIDIDIALSCKDGEELNLWTKPTYHSINAYKDGYIGGNGLVFSAPKSDDRNARLLQALESGESPSVIVQRKGPRSLEFFIQY